jgi:hypothetical protein
MSTQRSRATGRWYPLTTVCAIYRVPRTAMVAQTVVTVAAVRGKWGCGPAAPTRTSWPPAVQSWPTVAVARMTQQHAKQGKG